MFSGLTLVVPPAFDPISVADVKAHSRFYAGVEDSLIAGYIAAATRDCEKICKRAFLPQTWRLALKHFPGRTNGPGLRYTTGLEVKAKWEYIPIPKPPLVSITSFTYQDTAGVVGNMTQGYGNQVGNYLLDIEPEPGRLYLPFSGIWPTTILLPGSPIQITYVCGYPSFVGTANVDASGVATWQSGNKFDPRLVGTWMNFGGGSFDVLGFTDDQTIQLAVSNNGLTTLPLAGVTFRGSAVPSTIQMAILYLATHYFQNRIPIATGRGLISVEVQNTMDDLLSAHRVNIAGMPD